MDFLIVKIETFKRRAHALSKIVLKQRYNYYENYYFDKFIIAYL
jgi:hypothetical protein